MLSTIRNNDNIIDPRGSHEVIIENIEEEKIPRKKQNSRYQYLQADESKSLRKIHENNKRSRRKSLNDAYWSPLILKSEGMFDIRANEIGASPQSLEKFIHSHRERREIGREVRNHNNKLSKHHANSEEDVKHFKMESFACDWKDGSFRRKEERKSNSDTHSPFVSFNEQGFTMNHIDDYGRTWTSATFAAPNDNDFWINQETKRSSFGQNESTGK